MRGRRVSHKDEAMVKILIVDDLPDNSRLLAHLARDQGYEASVACNGRQALEIAIALKLSAQRGHQRVHLPLEDRSLRIFPSPFRLQGGDAIGWTGRGGGYANPPEIV